MLEELAYHLAVDGLLAGVDDALQEEVALLQLVIEEKVALTQDEVLRVQLFHGTATQYVQTCKEPATAAALLVRDSCILYLYAEVLVLGSGILLVDCYLADAHITDSVTHRLLGRCSCIASLQGLQNLWGDATLGAGH